MLRGLILLVLIAGACVLALPFVVSSLYVDQRGITIPGRVYSRQETVTVQYSKWKRLCEITIEYSPPDTSAVSFLGVRLAPERYDAFHTGEPVRLHYLLRKDVPDLPLANFLRELHALPTARLSGERAFSGLEALFTGRTATICWIVAGLVVLLFLWRRSGARGLGWAVGGCIFLGVVATTIADFPTPVPGPAVAVRGASATVKSVDRIDRLFEGSHERGLEAEQPVDVVALEFVPVGRNEPVVAVDLIDAGSLPGLKQGLAVAIEYESGSPRTAHVQNATRGFVRRNLAGIVEQAVLCLLLLAGFLIGAHYLGRAYKRLLNRPK